MADTEPPQPSTPEELYLDLMKKVLTRIAFGDTRRVWAPKVRRPVRRSLVAGVQRLLRLQGLTLMQDAPLDLDKRTRGVDQPPDAETMVGMLRLNNLQRCITDVLEKKIPGDLIETGVWRGGATIFMRACLKAYGDTDRTVWVADSFEGLPPPDAERYPADKDDPHWTKEKLAIGVEIVKGNFERYGLLDEQVRFLVGFFSRTLRDAPIDRLAILRLDGDMYESTMDALTALYDKLSVGGYLIVDDYYLSNCRAAIDDFRAERGISTPMERIDDCSVFWRRES